MKEKDRELLTLRQKTLALNEKLIFIPQFSWRIKKIKDVYSLDTKDIDELQFFYDELEVIYSDLCEFLEKNPLDKEEVQNEK